MQIVSMIQHRDKAPTNALIAQAVRSCAERRSLSRVRELRLREQQRDSLSDFKRHNGFRRVDLPRYYLPSPSMGRTALRLGLHRRLSTGFRSRCSRGCERLASRWYGRQLQVAKGAQVTQPHAGYRRLVTGMPRERAERELRRMVDGLRHESFYEAGTWIEESLGVYVGWCARENSFAERCRCAVNEATSCWCFRERSSPRRKRRRA